VGGDEVIAWHRKRKKKKKGKEKQQAVFYVEYVSSNVEPIQR
jgi:hypothetical protein